MLNSPIHILIVDDSPSDAGLMVRQLEKSGLSVVSTRVETAEQMHAALVGGAWDIVLCDFSLLGFDANEALSLLRKDGLDIPFIVVSGRIAEELAIKLMRAGASDYLMKNNLERLASAVARELQASKVRKEKRSAETAQHISESRFKKLFNLAPMPLCFFDKNGVILDANTRFEQAFGYSHVDIPTLNEWLQRVFPDTDYRRWILEALRVAAHQVVEHHGDMPPIECRVTCKSGEIRIIMISGIVIEDNYLATFYDVTDSKQAEITLQHHVTAAERARAAMLNILEDQREAHARLSKSELKLKTILQTSQDGFWLVNMHGRLVEVNDAYCCMSGYSRAELLTMEISDLEGRETAAETAEHIQLVIARGGDRFESRHRRKDGSSFDVEVSAQYRVADDGFFAVFLRDISELKVNQHELSIAATAFESQEGMIITDPNQAILRVNKAFSFITGYSIEDIAGKTPAILKSGRQDVRFYRDMWEIINRDHYWSGEIWNCRKNGEEYPLWLTITAVNDASGAVTNYVGTFIDTSQHKQAEQTIHNLSFYDALTGLPNRRLLLDRMTQASLSKALKDLLGAILLINLDSFKIINETRGHEVGDLLLIELAKRIRACLYPDDILARPGSDEFVVLLGALSGENRKAAQQSEGVAERIRSAIKQPFYLRGREYFCTVCIGISLFHSHETNMEELLKRASAAMFQAKETGRDKVHFFDAGLQAALEERFLLESWLRKAIPEELCLFYQLQVDSQGNILGAEVLIRWIHPGKGMIAPVSFIPMAEQSGLILLIGRWVLETACQQLKLWESNRSTRNLILAVNVSVKQFHQIDFVDQVLDVLSKTGADPTRLKLELTESMLVENVQTIIEKMNALKAIGVLFSLDDFGTGFSSLSYLKRLPLDQLKIDQSFVHDLLTDPNDAAIVRTVIALGHSLGLSVIAEGVETEEQRNFLAVNGCHNYQGYLFGKPVLVGDFEKLLKKTV